MIQEKDKVKQYQTNKHLLSLDHMVLKKMLLMILILLMMLLFLMKNWKLN